MAQVFVTGPVDTFCGVGPGNAPLFLGHGERGARIEIQEEFVAVKCDLGGSRLAFDELYDGQRARITIDLIRFQHNVLDVIEDRANANESAVAGINDAGEIGSLMVAENKTYPLWLRFPYANKAVFQQVANGVMPAGYRFVAAKLGGPEVISTGTGTAKKHRLRWDCLRVFDPTAANTLGPGRLILFDKDMSGLPAVS